VTSGGERFAIPQVSLLELVRLDVGQNEKAIEMVHGVPVYRLRGRLLPVVDLNRELGLTSVKPAAAESCTNIVVLQADGREFGLMVDEITDTEEIVVKPLGRQLKGITVYSGATIMGDGRVALILDILGLAQRAQIVSESQESVLNEKQTGKRDASGGEEKISDRQSLLVVQCGESGRMAIPLSLVARLEELKDTAVEFAGTQEVTQYRGEIIPLIRLPRFLGVSELANPDSRLPVVVYSEGGRSVGLIVDRIIDIVDEKLMVQNPSARRGILGSLVIQKRVTDMLDVPGVVRDAIPGFAESAAAGD
jgi:two-component system, chemotaxis family, sensor kinase CheA